MCNQGTRRIAHLVVQENCPWIFVVLMFEWGGVIDVHLNQTNK